MKYPYWRMKNPTAPIFLKDIGKMTRMALHTLRNNNSQTIRKGTRVTVLSAHRGRFNIETSGGICITFVHPMHVRYIGPPSPRPKSRKARRAA